MARKDIFMLLTQCKLRHGLALLKALPTRGMLSPRKKASSYRLHRESHWFVLSAFGGLMGLAFHPSSFYQCKASTELSRRLVYYVNGMKYANLFNKKVDNGLYPIKNFFWLGIYQAGTYWHQKMEFLTGFMSVDFNPPEAE